MDPWKTIYVVSAYNYWTIIDNKQKRTIYVVSAYNLWTVGAYNCWIIIHGIPFRNS